MSRPPRLFLEDAVYYVTVEGPYNEPIFQDKADYQKYLELLNQHRSDFHFKLFAYALTPSRVHLLMEACEEHPISQIMLNLTPHYTKYFNHRHNRKGPLFQKRFRSVSVEKQAYLPRLTRYIHKLPSQAYGSYTAYLQNGRASMDLGLDLQGEAEEVIGELSHTSLVEGENVYERYVLSADSQEIQFLSKKLSRGFILGSDAFAERVRERIKNAEHQTAVPSVSGVRMYALSTVLTLTVMLSTFAVYINHRTQELLPRPQQMISDRTPLKVTAYDMRAPLDGVIFEIELMTVAADGSERPIRDKIKFVGKSFESDYFSTQGFTRSNYTLTANPDGSVTWETLQTNAKGETVSWRGDLQGKKMEGSLSHRLGDDTSKDFSFLSNASVGGMRNA